ncbi:hypothetical protein WM43_20185 [Aeromonas veronii]|uniref:Uncharacterized protein n=1 Tax=Aeromonas veronii TaxID=654 RepID=A0AAC9BAV1_AERVE|nr:hypothetical protein [Aeromonas veronii]ANB54805.1 hypothetical protein WM43_20185 [Aeromonas veronii]
MNDEQGAFELWLADKCPSGDVESVQQQWLGSVERHDFAARNYDALVNQRDELLAALEEARTGLTWYQDAYPEAANGSDDEAMTRIDIAIANAKGGAA